MTLQNRIPGSETDPLLHTSCERAMVGQTRPAASFKQNTNCSSGAGRAMK